MAIYLAWCANASDATGALMFSMADDNLPDTLEDNAGGVRGGVAATMDWQRRADMLRHMSATGGGVGPMAEGERKRENCQVLSSSYTTPS